MREGGAKKIASREYALTKITLFKETAYEIATLEDNLLKVETPKDV